MRNILGRRLPIIIIIFGSIIFNGCDEEEPIPAYIYIDAIDLQTTNGEGSGEHGITDAWVSVGTQLVGAFPLPAIIPVLESGEQEVTIFGGIVQNGIGSTRDIYPFYERYTVNTTLEPMLTDTIRPTMRYVDEASFVVVEDFEASNIISDDIDGNSATTVSITSDDVFEGNRSGRILLTPEDQLIEVGTNLYYELGEAVGNVYTELHYKNDVNLEIGITGRGTFYFERFYKVGVIPSSEWKKVYIDLTTEVSTMLVNGATEFQLVMRAINATDSNANIYIDNVKLIYK